MPRYLVVANRTLVGEHLLAELRARVAPDASFHVVVPASQDPEHATWTEGRALAAARTRLDEALRTFAEQGIDATGEVGDTDPVNAVVDAAHAGPYDTVIVSTLPPGLSRWLRQDLPHRIARAVPGTEIVHVVADAAFAAPG